MIVRDVMNQNVNTVSPETPLFDVARQMRDGDFGVMPVIEGEKVIGMITDRDITVRASAEAKDVKSTYVRDAMTPDVLTCFEDDDLDKITALMSDRQVRRIPVLSRDNKLVGLLSIGDMARSDQASDNAGIALAKISEPRHDEPGAQVQH